MGRLFPLSPFHHTPPHRQQATLLYKPKQVPAAKPPRGKTPVILELAKLLMC